MNKLKKQWEEEQLWNYFLINNEARIRNLVWDELEIKKKHLNWWRRNWNTSKDIKWVDDRIEKLLKMEFDALRGK